MANRYNTPAQAEFRDYTMDLPFNELLSVGSTLAGRADKAQKDLAEYRKEHSDFNSLSAIDNQRYNDLTIGRLSPVVEEMVMNPDLIKTAEGRSKIQNAINGGDYAAINQLKSSAANMNALQASYAELAKKGQFNPNWHNVDFSNYDTIGSGKIFSNTSATPYQSLQDLSSDQMNSLKPMMMPNSSDGVWKRKGFTEERIAETAMAIADDLSLSDVGRKHMDEAVAMGLTTEDSKKLWLANSIYELHKNKAGVVDETVDPLVMKQIDHGYRMAEIKYRENMAAKAAAAKAAEKDGKDGEQFSAIDNIVRAHNTNIDSHVRTMQMPMSDSLKNGLNTYLTNIGIAPSSIKALLSTTSMTSDGGFDSVLEQIKASDEGINITPDREAQIKAAYYSDRRISVGQKVRMGETLPGEFDVNIGDGVRDYYNLSLNNPSNAAKSKVYTSETGETFDTTPISKNWLHGAYIMNDNEQIISGYDANSLETDFNKSYLDGALTTYGGIASLAVAPAVAGSAAVYGIGKSIKSWWNSDNFKEDVASLDDKDLVKFAFNNIPNIEYSTGGDTTWVGGDNGDGYYAKGYVTIPVDQWKKTMSEFAKTRGFKSMDGDDLYDLTSGEYGSEYALGKVEELKSRRFNAKDSDKEEKVKVIRIPVASRILQDDYKNTVWNANTMTNDYGTTVAGKNVSRGLSTSQRVATSTSREQMKNKFNK